MHTIVVFVIIALMLVCRGMHDQFYHIEGLTVKKDEISESGLTGSTRPSATVTGATGPAKPIKKTNKKKRKSLPLVNDPPPYKGNSVF